MPSACVILPVYNAALTVRNAITSVLEQTMDDFSLIVVDDGSTDDSLEALHSFDDPRLLVLENGGNRGIEYSLNRCIKAADCDYIFRLDSDDICLPTRLEKQMNYLSENPRTWVLGSWAELVFDDNSISLIPMPVQNEQIKARLLFHNAFIHPSVAMRRDVVERTGYASKYPRAEDYDLWCKLACNPGIVFHNIPEALIRYKISGEGLSFGNRQEQLCSTRLVRKDFFCRLGINTIATVDTVDTLGTLDTTDNFPLHNALADGVWEAEFTEYSLQLLLAWLDNLSNWNLHSGFTSGEALNKIFSSRFTALANTILVRAPELGKVMRESRYYIEEYSDESILYA